MAHAIMGTVGMVVHKYILYTPLLFVVPSTKCSAAEAIQLLLNGLQLVQRREKHTAHMYSAASSTSQHLCSAHLFTPYIGFLTLFQPTHACNTCTHIQARTHTHVQQIHLSTPLSPFSFVLLENKTGRALHE